MWRVGFLVSLLLARDNLLYTPGPDWASGLVVFHHLADCGLRLLCHDHFTAMSRKVARGDLVYDFLSPALVD